MPNVPNVPGVPALASYGVNNITLMVIDAVSALVFGVPRWGIFRAGQPVLPIRSVVSFDYKQDWSIADYPIEDGGFQSYDKVQLPFEARVRITSDSNVVGRQALLDAMDVVANSLDLYDILTPEKVYLDCNVSHYDLHRTAQNGVGMIVMDVWFTEIRIRQTVAFSNTKSPTSAGQTSNGNVQPSSFDEAGFSSTALEGVQ